ncbi:MAG: sigma-54-dependent Fis family transcriptional regulator, partial [Mariprofundaceae bacterium]|nr:sigma-54-dependent Fis family transcriptional regulator [Mariprofundaceae bacterium]
MTVNAAIYLLDFTELVEADVRVQLGRMLPDTQVTSYTKASEIEQWVPECDAIILIWDGLTVLSRVRKLFEKQPQANVVVLAAQGDANRAEDLMELGVMDYRMLPCPDEAMEIYVRKAGHQAELSRQAETQRQGSDVFITQDIDTRRLLDQVALVAPSQASVLVVGESGTGKERLSRYVHQCSNRRDRAFVAINCAAIPDGMLESELFGHEKGAFTGATQSRPGKFEIAHEGTLLLDEITEMPLHLQAKLLRVLQEGEIDRLGGSKPVKVDVRIIATSNRNIVQSVEKGEFRQDLYYRLNVVTIQLPPLRQRPHDIQLLAEHFLQKFSEMY